MCCYIRGELREIGVCVCFCAGAVSMRCLCGANTKINENKRNAAFQSVVVVDVVRLFDAAPFISYAFCRAYNIYTYIYLFILLTLLLERMDADGVGGVWLLRIFKKSTICDTNII